MVKSVEKAVKEVVEGKTQNIELYENKWSVAVDENVLTLMAKHEDVAGYSVNGDWIAIMSKDGSTHVYSAHNVDYIKHYNAE